MAEFKMVVGIIGFLLFILSPFVFISTEQAADAQGVLGIPVPSASPNSVTSIYGKGFGNNGNSFSAFVECSDGKYFSFEKGSLITFSSGRPSEAPQDNDQFYDDSAIGTWQIEYGTIEFDHFLYQGGIITGMSLQGGSYLLYGVETQDDICGTENERIIIETECIDDTPIKYLNSVGDRSGSTTPPDYAKVYQFFSAEVTCS